MSLIPRRISFTAFMAIAAFAALAASPRPGALQPEELEATSQSLKLTAELECSTCQWWNAELGGEVVGGEHKFPNGADECQGGGQHDDEEDSDLRPHGPHSDHHPRSLAEIVEEELTGCRACGGESQCHTGWQSSGSSGGCHQTCSGGGGSEEAVLAGIAEGDAEKVGHLTKENSRFVFINLARSAVQTLDCRGAVRRNIAVSESFIARSLAVINRVSD